MSLGYGTLGPQLRKNNYWLELFKDYVGILFGAILVAGFVVALHMNGADYKGNSENSQHSSTNATNQIHLTD